MTRGESKMRTEIRGGVPEVQRLTGSKVRRFRTANVQRLRSLRLKIQKWELRSSRSAKVQRFKSAEVQKSEGS